MGTLDSSWRLLLGAENESALCELVYQQIAAFVDFSEKRALVDKSEYLEELADSRKDLTRFTQALHKLNKPYFLPGKGYAQDKISFRDLTYLIKNEARTAKDSSKPIIESLAALGFEIPALVNILRQHRNRQSHDNSQMEEPEFALQLAAAILRIINIRLTISEHLKADIEKLKFQAMEIVNYCSSYYTVDPDEELKAAPPESNEGPNIGVETHLQGSISKTEQSKGRAPSTESLDELTGLVRSFQNSTERSVNVIEMQLRDLGRRVGELSFKMPATESTIIPNIDYSADPKDLTNDFGDRQQWQFGHEQALNEEAVRDQLLKMRIDIKNYYNDRGIRIANWINVLQRPMVEELIETRVTTEKEWRELSTFQEKWKMNSDEHELINSQLESWGRQALGIMGRMVTKESFEKVAGEIDF